MLSAYLVICAALLFGASETKPVDEARLVGTWQSTCDDCFDIHGSGWIAYRSDHTCTLKSYSEEGASFAHGTWKLRGRQLTVDFSPIVTHETILTIAADQFQTRAKIGDEVKVFTYTRVKDEP
jgi:hypothetical protein